MARAVSTERMVTDAFSTLVEMGTGWNHADANGDREDVIFYLVGEDIGDSSVLYVLSAGYAGLVVEFVCTCEFSLPEEHIERVRVVLAYCNSADKYPGHLDLLSEQGLIMLEHRYSWVVPKTAELVAEIQDRQNEILDFCRCCVQVIQAACVAGADIMRTVELGFLGFGQENRASKDA